MRENLSTNFRYTKAAGRYAFLALGVVPGLLLFGAYKFAVSTARPLPFRITTRGPFLTVFFFFFFFFLLRANSTLSLSAATSPSGDSTKRAQTRRRFPLSPESFFSHDSLLKYIPFPTTPPFFYSSAVL